MSENEDIEANVGNDNSDEDNAKQDEDLEDSEDQNNINNSPTKRGRDFEPLEIILPASVLKKPKLSEDTMQIHELQINKVLEDTFNPDSKKPFNIQKYNPHEEQKEEIHKHALEVPKVWEFDGIIEQPLSKISGQYQKAIADEALFKQQKQTRDLQSLNIGVMLAVAKDDKIGAIEKALELHGGIINLEAAQFVERQRYRNPSRGLELVRGRFPSRGGFGRGFPIDKGFNAKEQQVETNVDSGGRKKFWKRSG